MIRTHKSIEDSYCLRDAEHQDGTNKYTFRYNFQWRNIIHEHLTVSVRSVKLWLAPRHLWVEGLKVHTSSGTDSTGFNTTITGSMSEFNDKLANMVSGVGYRVYYNPTNRRLVFDCATGNYFPLTDLISNSESVSLNGITEANPVNVPISDLKFTYSNDLKVITSAKSTFSILNANSNHQPTTFCFNDVWDRENVHISASFVDLGYHNFLGVSNEQFIPPKEYPISFTDQIFAIELFDSTEKPVEIPSLDNKDTLLLELILNSYS